MGESSSCTGGWKSETYYVSSAAGKCHVVHNDNFGSIKASTSSVSVFANKDCSGNPLLHENKTNSCMNKQRVMSFDTALPTATSSVSYSVQTLFVNQGNVPSTNGQVTSSQCGGSFSYMNYFENGKCYNDGTDSFKYYSNNSYATMVAYSADLNCAGTAKTYSYPTDTCLYADSGTVDVKAYPTSHKFSTVKYSAPGKDKTSSAGKKASASVAAFALAGLAMW